MIGQAKECLGEIRSFWDWVPLSPSLALPLVGGGEALAENMTVFSELAAGGWMVKLLLLGLGAAGAWIYLRGALKAAAAKAGDM